MSADYSHTAAPHHRMLLYIHICACLFSWLAAELGQHDLLHRPLLAAGLMLLVVAGAAVMCVLGMWA